MEVCSIGSSQVKLSRTIEVGLCSSKNWNTKILKLSNGKSKGWNFGRNLAISSKSAKDFIPRASVIPQIQVPIVAEKASTLQNHSRLEGGRRMAALSGFFRRKLPSPPAIDFASDEGKKLFAEALDDGCMEGFFKLMPFFQTQSELTYCGLASLSMILNALDIDPKRIWKGPWRFFDESMLDSCEPLEEIKARGATIDTILCMGRCAGSKMGAFRTNQTSIDEFRKNVVACTSSHDRHMILSYHRGVFNQTGSGHFSPIGGYNRKSDEVLILDVARFKYPPHWVPLSLLWEAMDTVMPESGLRRGFMLVSKLKDSSFLPTLSCKNENWIATAKYLMDDAPELLKSRNLKSIRDVLSTIFKSLPSNFSELITSLVEGRHQEENGAVSINDEMLRLVRETSIHKHVLKTLSSGMFCGENEQNLEQKSGVIEQGDDVLAALLLALPPQTWNSIKDGQVLQEMLSLVSTESLPTFLQDDILCLRANFFHTRDATIEYLTGSLI